MEISFSKKRIRDKILLLLIIIEKQGYVCVIINEVIKNLKNDYLKKKDLNFIENLFEKQNSYSFNRESRKLLVKFDEIRCLKRESFRFYSVPRKVNF